MAARQLAAAGKPPPEELQGPELPQIAAHVLAWFNELQAWRGSSGLGPARITQALDAWARWTGARPTPLEVEWLLELDEIWLKHQSDESAGKADRQKGKAP